MLFPAARQIQTKNKGLGVSGVGSGELTDRELEGVVGGITIDIALWKFETQKFYVTIIDAPGHRAI